MSTVTVPARLNARPTRPRRPGHSSLRTGQSRQSAASLRSARSAQSAERSARTRHPAGRARGAVRPVLVEATTVPDPAGERPTGPGESARALRLVSFVDASGVVTLTQPGAELGSAVRRAVVGSVAVPLLVPRPAGAPIRWTPRAVPEAPLRTVRPAARPSARPTVRPAVRRAPVRLTRRARLLLTLLATVALVGALLSVLGPPRGLALPSPGSLLGTGMPMRKPWTSSTLDSRTMRARTSPARSRSPSCPIRQAATRSSALPL